MIALFPMLSQIPHCTHGREGIQVHWKKAQPCQVFAAKTSKISPKGSEDGGCCSIISSCKSQMSAGHASWFSSSESGNQQKTMQPGNKNESRGKFPKYLRKLSCVPKPWESWCCESGWFHFNLELHGSRASNWTMLWRTVSFAGLSYSWINQYSACVKCTCTEKVCTATYWKGTVHWLPTMTGTGRGGQHFPRELFPVFRQQH